MSVASVSDPSMRSQAPVVIVLQGVGKVFVNSLDAIPSVFESLNMRTRRSASLCSLSSSCKTSSPERYEYSDFYGFADNSTQASAPDPGSCDAGSQTSDTLHFSPVG
eukprot:TRINITY_DN38528_c0_g2_i2.p1 TRINITY_DN38528_c0_g2~~TRINITY_DN38528_c0_g2_i2.p1  ORF type:complete len:107 (+),score=8.21 TRINITY_DN38528_c0_g2_i2:61-381(+)